MPGLRDILEAATPGRWEAARSVVISVADPRDGVAVAPTEADAALIALAPELAALVLDADDWLECENGQFGSRGLCNFPEEPMCTPCALHVRIARLGAGDSNQNEKEQT